MTVRAEKPSVNLREKLAELDKPTGIAGEAMLRAETPQEQFNLIGAGRRNILINGDFQVWQRGANTSATNATNNVYYTDRFKTRNSQSASDMTIQHITNDHPPNTYGGHAIKCVSTTGATTTEHVGLTQTIEDYEKLAGQTVTYSAWVKANTAVQIWVYEFGAVNVFSASENHSGNGEWEKLTVTHTLLSNNSISSVITYITTYGNTTPTNGYHISTQHQLELGKVATPFEHRSYGEELALCQRYYYRLQADGALSLFYAMGQGYTSNGVFGAYAFPVEMRTRPTSLEQTGTPSDYFIDNGSGTSVACTSVPTFGSSTNKYAASIVYTSTGNSASGAARGMYINTNGYLGWSAEL